MFQKIKEELKDWFEFLFVRHAPGRIGHLIRQGYWRRRFNQCRSLQIGVDCTILAPENITMGEGISIMPGCYFYAHNRGIINLGNRVVFNNHVILSAADDGKITIGNNVLIGPNVVLRASNHQFERKDRPIIEQEHTGGTIVIHDDVWIGANVVILPGVTIGTGAVVGAGAVVNRDVPDYAFAAGVPAKVIKEDCRSERIAL